MGLVAIVVADHAKVTAPSKCNQPTSDRETLKTDTTGLRTKIHLKKTCFRFDELTTQGASNR